MGRGRGRTAVVGALGAALLTLGIAGCGAESTPNDPRPEPSARVSVTIGPEEVLVTPRRISFGPERNQQIPQNRNHPQPSREVDAALDVVFVAANQTATDSPIEIRGPEDAESEPIFARSPGSLQTELPSGTYTIVATDVPGAKPGKLVVGPYRASSQNDVLLP
jgi:hypothetical protein